MHVRLGYLGSLSQIAMSWACSHFKVELDQAQSKMIAKSQTSPTVLAFI